ncbi:MAG: 6-aminohexanoate hydrolase [Halioglobus sp.]|nr:6-aminohexanoate hydrolase [Halioglobus sp.]
MTPDPTDDLAGLDATAQAELVRSGQASPLELVDAAIARIERHNGALNAVIHERFERARQEAQGALPDGPFRGVPFLLKDLDGFSAGDPYHAGNRALAAASYRAPADSCLTQRFRAAGLVILGRTNTPELGLMPSTEPLAQGPTRNPWNPAHTPGGSSGGSAAAVAAGFVPMAHAGDGGGSIRIPAASCGLVGLKPARGRITLGPEAGEAWGGLVARLALTRTVRDCAAILQAVQGPLPGDPYTAQPPARPYTAELAAPGPRLRVGYTTRSPDPNISTQADCVTAVERSASLLRELGHQVEEAAPASWSSADDFQATMAHFMTAYGVWTAAELDRLAAMLGRPVTEQDVEPGTWLIAEPGRSANALDYLAAIEYFHRASRDLAGFWSERGYDLLLTPVMPEPPPPLGQFHDPDNPLAGLLRSSQVVPFMAPFNISGQPAMSLPLHRSDAGLPIGVQLVAAPWREDVLLNVAAELETAAPWPTAPVLPGETTG